MKNAKDALEFIADIKKDVARQMPSESFNDLFRFMGQWEHIHYSQTSEGRKMVNAEVNEVMTMLVQEVKEFCS
jgi:hypothetical protein